MLTITTLAALLLNLQQALTIRSPHDATVELYPTVTSVGITATDASGRAVAGDVRYREIGAATWHDGHPLALINDGKLRSSLFWLTADTPYEVTVVLRDASRHPIVQGQARTTTLPELPPNTVQRVFHVKAGSPPGGDGSTGKPFAKISDGVNAASAGDQVLVQAGVYHEEVYFPRVGTAGAFIQVTGEPGAVIDGADADIAQNGLPWSDDATADVYHAPLAVTIPALWRDSARSYQYDSLDGLRAGVGHGGVPMAEGWFETGGLLYVRSFTPPATHTWQVPVKLRAFYLGDREYIWIEGFTTQFEQGASIYLLGSSHCVVRGNTFLSSRWGVWLADRNSSAVADDNYIDHNTIADYPVGQWPYALVKGTSHEGTGIFLQGGHGSIVRGNRIEQYFNGMGTGDSLDAEIFENVMRDLGDDGFEPDGNGINVRFFRNAVDHILTGLSLAPVSIGPLWVIRNRFTYFTGRAIKTGGGVDGLAYVYHNTAYTDVANRNGMEAATTDTSSIVLRNNIAQVTAYGVSYGIPMPGLSLEHDNWYTTSSSWLMRWNGVDHKTLAAFCGATAMECTGADAVPGFIDPTRSLFALLPGSVNVDAATPVPGINATFAGAAPDRGYVETGDPEISW